MNNDLLSTYAAFHLRGIDLLLAVSERTREDLATLGFSPAEASRLVGLAKTYIRPGHRGLIEQARANEHSLDTLHMIRRIANKRVDGGDPLDLIAEFVGLTGSYAEIERRAVERVTALNLAATGTERKSYGRRRAAISHTEAPDGTMSMTVTGPAADIAALKKRLAAGIARRRKANPKLTRGQAVYDELFAHLGGAGAPAGEGFASIAAIRLEDHMRVIRGDGDDITIATTDGRMISGADYANSVLLEHNYFALVHPVDGALNLYQAERFANDKQRMLAKIETMLCAWFNCTTPADDCQIHHLVAFAQGGFTRIGDLAALCALHNGMNDDDPDGEVRNGRIVRDPVTGRMTHQPTGKINEHPLARRGIMDLI